MLLLMLMWQIWTAGSEFSAAVTECICPSVAKCFTSYNVEIQHLRVCVFGYWGLSALSLRFHCAISHTITPCAVIVSTQNRSTAQPVRSAYFSFIFCVVLMCVASALMLSESCCHLTVEAFSFFSHTPSSSSDRLTKIIFWTITVIQMDINRIN